MCENFVFCDFAVIFVLVVFIVRVVALWPFPVLHSFFLVLLGDLEATREASL
jgi:hypothetical protein